MELIRPDITPQELLAVLDTNIKKGKELASCFPQGSTEREEIDYPLHIIMLAWAELKVALDGSDEDYIDFIFEVVKRDVHDELVKRLIELEMSQKFLQGKLNCIGRA
jgi:hypothetical protein